MKKKKKLSPFAIGLMIYTAVLAIVIAVGLMIFSNFLAAYEASLPETALALLSDSSLPFAQREGVANAYLSNSSVNTDEQMRDALCALADGAEKISFSKNYTHDHHTDKTPVYSIRADGERIGDVSLCEGEEGSFGFGSWRISQVYLYPDILLSEQIFITPKGAQLSLNGSVISNEYVSDTFIAEGSYGITDGKKYDLYVINALPKATAAATLDGESLLNSQSSGAVVFAYPTLPAQVYVITAPKDAIVTFDGQQLYEEHISSFNAGRAEKRSAFDKDDSLPIYVTYEVKSESEAPSVQASYNGEALASEDGLYFPYPESIYKTYTLSAPSSCAVYVNGITLGSDYMTDEAKLSKDVEKYAQNPDRYKSYEISDVISELDISYSYGSESLKTEGDGYDIVIPRNASLELKEKYTDDARAFVLDYVYYTSMGYIDIDANHENVKKRVYGNTELYTVIVKSKEAIKWNSPMQISYDSLECDNFTYLADNIFECEVSYDLDLIYYTQTRNYKGVYTLTFIITDEGRYLIDMINTAE